MKNVLLVDDDEIFNFISEQMLHKIGFTGTIRLARNGKDALKVIDDCHGSAAIMPDVILLDLNMPVMDGFGFLDAFLHLSIPDKQSIRIVIVSSSMDPLDIKRAKELGATGYVSKPITEQALKNLLFN